MEIMEVIVLIIGIILFFVSFFIGDNKDAEVDSHSVSEEEIKDLVREEFDRTRDKLNSITDETVSYSMEKAERALDKITNEKMMAMGEYSDTIMNQINTNHQEAVFLNDMLVKNKNDLTVLLGQAMKDAQEAKEASELAVEQAKKAGELSLNAISKSEEAAANSVVAEEKMINARKAISFDSNIDSLDASTEVVPTQDTATDDRNPEADKKENDEKPVENTTKKKRARKKKQADEDSFNGAQISLSFDTEPDGSNGNNNERILNLHKMGKSNVAIAKELGLGVGEVKLVIDLFKED